MRQRPLFPVQALVLAITLFVLLGLPPGPAWAVPGDGRFASLGIGVFGEAGGDDESVAFVCAGFGTFLLERLSLALEAVGYDLDDNGNSSRGPGINLAPRYYVADLGWGWLYVDGSFGVILAEDDFPKRGSEFNFVEQIGPGLELVLTPWTTSARLSLGVRVLHLSNGRSDCSNNPGFTGLGGYLGLFCRF